MPTPRSPVSSFGWTSLLFRKEFLILAIALLAIILVGLANVAIHGQHPRGGVDAVGIPPVPHPQSDH